MSALESGSQGVAGRAGQEGPEDGWGDRAEATHLQSQGKKLRGHREGQGKDGMSSHQRSESRQLIKPKERQEPRLRTWSESALSDPVGRVRRSSEAGGEAWWGQH